MEKRIFIYKLLGNSPKRERHNDNKDDKYKGSSINFGFQMLPLLSRRQKTALYTVSILHYYSENCCSLNISIKCRISKLNIITMKVQLFT